MHIPADPIVDDVLVAPMAILNASQDDLVRSKLQRLNDSGPITRRDGEHRSEHVVLRQRAVRVVRI